MTAQPTTCRSCGAEIVWARTASGKLAPFERDVAGEWSVIDGHAFQALGNRGYTSHFATCPHAGRWRRKR